MSGPAYPQPPEPPDQAAVAPGPREWTVPSSTPAPAVPPPVSHAVVTRHTVPSTRVAGSAARPVAQPTSRSMPQAASPSTPAVGRELHAQPRGLTKPPTLEFPPGAPPRTSPPEASGAPTRRRLPLPWLVWQLALVAAGLALQAPMAVRLALLSLAVVSLLLSAVRVRSALLYEWVFCFLRFAMRRGQTVLPDSDAKADTLIAYLLGRSAVRTMDVRGEPAVVVSTAEGVTTILRPTSAEPVSRVPRPADLLRAVDEQPTDVVTQTVLHTGTRRDEPRIWFAIRVLRSPDVALDGNVEQVLGNAVRRVLKELSRRGAASLPVPEYDARGTLVSLAHINANRGDVHEAWQLWAAGPIVQVTFRLDGLERLEPIDVDAAVEALLQGSGGVATTVALTARREESHRDEGPVTAGVLRVAAAARIDLENAAGELSSLGAAWGLHLERLDGRHLGGVIATLPLGIPAP